MEKTIFLFTLALAIALISGYRQSDQNGMKEKNGKPLAPKDIKGIKKTDVHESKTDRQSFTTIETPDGKPKILLMLTNDTGLASWSPSLWWKYEHAKPGQTGC